MNSNHNSTSSKFRKESFGGTRCFCILLFCAIFMSLFTACDGEEPSDTSRGSKDSMYGGEVIVGITQEPSIFDPHTVVAAGDEEILFNIFEGLVKCNAEGEFLPALCTEYSISEDSQIYTFTIRENVTFHNGETMTPEDVVFSLRRAAGLDTGVALKPELSNISNVYISDQNLVIIELASPDSEMIPFLNTAIIPSTVEDINATPVGTGPFAFVEYRVGESVILDRNDNYWQEELPYLDRVIFKVTADMDAGFLELIAGSIDIFPYLTPDKASEIENQFNIVSDGSNMVHIFALNHAVEPFNNPLVREAMNYAVNREELINITMDGHGTPLVTGMSPTMGDYYNDSLDGRITYDPDKAVDLLIEAGYPNGFSSSITVPSNYKIHVDTAQVIADHLSRVGIDMTIVAVDWPTWLNDVYAGRNYDTTVIALTSEFTPRDVLNRYVSSSDGNFINYSNSEYDRIFNEIVSEPRRDVRIELYQQLQKLLLDDYASVYLQDIQNIVAVKNDLSGYVVYPIYVQDMSTVYFH